MSAKPLPPAMKNALLAAVIAEMPAAGTVWDHAGRESWFEMMRKAVDVAYGPLSPSGERPGKPAGAAVTEPGPAVKLHYAIEPDGTASANRRPIDPGEIPHDTVLHDYRPQPVDPEYNPIMWKTHGNKRLALPPGVIVRAAGESWPPNGLASADAEAQ